MEEGQAGQGVGLLRDEEIKQLFKTMRHIEICALDQEHCRKQSVDGAAMELPFHHFPVPWPSGGLTELTHLPRQRPAAASKLCVNTEGFPASRQVFCV